MTRMLNLSNTRELAVCQTALRSAAWQQLIAYLQAKDAGIKTVDLPLPGRNVVLFHMGRGTSLPVSLLTSLTKLREKAIRSEPGPSDSLKNSYSFSV